MPIAFATCSWVSSFLALNSLTENCISIEFNFKSPHFHLNYFQAYIT
nr:MAG TPA_asm: hypothetical protein [Caudoviricetes sp.]